LATIENVELAGSGLIGFPISPGLGDRFEIGDLTGTGIKTVSIDLKGSTESITLTGGDGADRILGGSSPGGGITLNGLPAAVTLKSIEASNHLVLSGGNGADVIDLSGITSQVGHKVSGGQGDDTITGLSGGYDPNNGFPQGLYGDEGNDVIVGGAASDLTGREHISGGTGSDTLSGGGEDALFYFAAGEAGSDIITNFDTSGDLIQLAGYADRSFAELRDRNHIAQVGSDVVITDTFGHVVVLLKGVALGDLSGANFLLG
jgi:hypothetical protein